MQEKLLKENERRCAQMQLDIGRAKVSQKLPARLHAAIKWTLSCMKCMYETDVHVDHGRIRLT